MDDMLVLTVATSPAKAYHVLLQSCEHHGIPLLTLGWGEAFANTAVKLHLTYRALQRVRGRYRLVLFVDAYDVAFVRNLDAVRDEFARFGHPLVFSAETVCWPDGDRAGLYPESPTRWRYLNSGGWIGDINYVLGILNGTGLPAPNDRDQRFWTEVFLHRPGAVVLDSECRIFQSLRDGGDDLRREGGGIVHNRVTDTRPAILHANGGDDLALLEQITREMLGR